MTFRSPSIPARRPHPRRTLLAALVLLGSSLHAHEGMWLPTLLEAIGNDMRTEGLLISPDELYSVEHSSLKDAIVLFGGGCTAEVISDQGLLLTNHHCGYSAIQQHSSLDHDYLKDGFWAATLGDELPNQGLTATFIVRMQDVTDRVLAGLTPDMSDAQRRAAAGKEGDAIAAEVTAGTAYMAMVKPFNYGNSYFLIVMQTFRDVRLVGAPPGAIGKFGGDTDNWMWPRHTGDLSIFRIYAGPDNAPADFALTNVPYRPARSLSICMDGVHEGDFDMIYGFPGSTQRYLSSFAVDYLQNTGDPLRIKMRRASLAVIDEAMLANERTHIQYAAKQSGISNAYKKWIGELRGITELGTLEKKRAFEARYMERTRQDPRYAAALNELRAAYAEYTDPARARDLYIEFYLVGPELMRFADGFRSLLKEHGAEELAAAGKLDAELDRLRKAAAGFHEDYDAAVDQRVFVAQLPIYLANMPPALMPKGLQEQLARFHGDVQAYAADLYKRSAFTSEAGLAPLLKQLAKKDLKKLRADPAFVLATLFTTSYNEQVKPRYDELSERIAASMRVFVEGQVHLFPERGAWPDANSTLRLSYGHVEGSRPHDGMIYTPFTTLSGIMAKYVPGDAEFDVPPRLVELYRSKDFGPYAQDGDVPVCFTSSLHTTGGNSGSPVLNARGELIGLNFDRTWESTMSDIEFDPAKCRNIAVDIRYVLFVVDKVCGAKRLVDEMHLVHHADEPYVIPLPIHR